MCNFCLFFATIYLVCKNTDIAVRNRNYYTATGNHMSYGITQCYLPPCNGDFPAFTRAEASTRSIYRPRSDARLS